MNLVAHQATGRGILLIGAWLAAAVTHADSDEAWLHRASQPDGARPLLGLILDRSLATATGMPVREDFDAARDYGAAVPGGASCDASRFWIRRGIDPLPDCTRVAGIALIAGSSEAGLQCEAARVAMRDAGFFIASRAAQWRTGAGGGYWHAPDSGNAGAVECRADRGVHGSTAGDWYAAEGAAAPWSQDRAQEIPWDRSPFADPYVFLSGNYLNYLRSTPATTTRPLAEILARGAATALAATAELDVALLSTDDDGPEGGFVARAGISSRDAAAELLGLAAEPPAGPAPLSETLTEALRWLAGGSRNFGLDDRTDPASLVAPGSNAYRSPFDHACTPVSMAYLTAGQPSDDDLGASAAHALPQFTEETGGCAADCLATLDSFLDSTDLRPDLPAVQSAAMSWITTESDAIVAGSRSYADPLAFIDLIAVAHQRDAAVAASPQLSAAALDLFDPGTGSESVIFGLTAPRPRERWPGNLLRYALKAPAGPLEPPLVADRDGVPAIGTDGLPHPGTRSLWSDAPDSNLLSGGAAGRLPLPDVRSIYSNVASDRIAEPANRLEPGNTRISRGLLGLGPPAAETVDEMLEAFRSLPGLGDPGVHAAAIAEYPAAGLRIVYAASHDGMLHALDADSGVELWAWMPTELLSRIPLILRDAHTTARRHGLEGPVVLHRHDPDGDGLIETADGEHLWLLLGLGRGGSRYYALDVSQPRDPRLMWSLDLPDSGVLALAEPIVARLSIAGSGQSANAWVAFLAGGYDRRFESRTAGGEGVGGKLLVVDAETGRLLWSAGQDEADLPVAGLASVAAAPRILDLDGDGEVDRAYVLDVVGNLWRMDLQVGRPADTLGTAYRLAHVAHGGRRFHYTPDASLVRAGANPLLAIAFGSGSRMRPRDELPEDALHVVRDVLVGAPARDLGIDDLHDVTGSDSEVPPDAPGWMLRLNAHGAGEKVASATTTFDHVLRFQTYEPLPPDPSEPCGPPRSVARRYAVDIRTAAPIATAVDSEEDEPEEIPASGLPPALGFGFPGLWDDACEGCRPRPFGILGGETFDPGYAGAPVRTSWRKLLPPASR